MGVATRQTSLDDVGGKKVRGLAVASGQVLAPLKGRLRDGDGARRHQPPEAGLVLEAAVSAPAAVAAPAAAVVALAVAGGEVAEAGRAIAGSLAAQEVGVEVEVEKVVGKGAVETTIGGQSQRVAKRSGLAGQMQSLKRQILSISSRIAARLPRCVAVIVMSGVIFLMSHLKIPSLLIRQ